MKALCVLLLLVPLAACGADGAPEAPASMDVGGSGVTISGCVKAGVTFGPTATGSPARC